MTVTKKKAQRVTPKSNQSNSTKNVRKQRKRKRRKSREKQEKLREALLERKTKIQQWLSMFIFCKTWDEEDEEEED